MVNVDGVIVVVVVGSGWCFGCWMSLPDVDWRLLTLVGAIVLVLEVVGATARQEENADWVVLVEEDGVEGVTEPLAAPAGPVLVCVEEDKPAQAVKSIPSFLVVLTERATAGCGLGEGGGGGGGGGPNGRFTGLDCLSIAVVGCAFD